MNKARRRRDTTSNATAGASAIDLYTVHGDANAALQELSSAKGPQKDSFNRDLLSYMAMDTGGFSNSSKVKMVSKMEDWEERFGNKESFPSLPAKKRTRNEWIAAYNRALLLLANGDIPQSNQACAEKLRNMVLGKKKASGEMSMVSSRMAFLFLEGILTNSLASFYGLQDFEEELTARKVVEWLEIQEPESDPQFKFILALYKSRLDFGERDDIGKHVDAKIRLARKELKTAMEVFQHKLRPSGSGEESIASSWEADSDVHNNNNMSANSQQQNAPMSLILRKHNQAALNLKANVEHLKGNPKKSLILLGEAHAAAPEDPFYDTMHANNLALVYEINCKRHLAMHSVGKALRVDLRKPNFQGDGTARPDPSIVTLYNSAICSLQARKFSSAYECMNACVKHSTVFAKRHRCWLLLAEACLGMHADYKKTATSSMFSTIEVQGEPKGIMIQNDVAHVKGIDGHMSEVEAACDDIESVKERPLLHARACLETTLHLLKEQGDKDKYAHSSACLSLSYVSLELRNWDGALKMAMLVIEQVKASTTTGDAKKRIENRQAATARMYAAEASCALGDATAGMRYLVGDGKDNDAYNRLASDLGGVTIEVAANNGKGKARLAKAQSMVRSSASAASTILGNYGPAKQLAMSAQAMEDAYSGSRDRSTARKALVYCMLREGNCGAALTLLRSLN